MINYQRHGSLIIMIVWELTKNENYQLKYY